MADLPSNETPTNFSQWLQTRALFADGAAETETRVTDGPEAGLRHASGKSADGSSFYISMTPAEEPIFLQAYNEWRSRNQGGVHTFATSPKPPGCGTSTTPQCEAA